MMVTEALDPSWVSGPKQSTTPLTSGAVECKTVDKKLSTKLGSGWGHEFIRYQSADNSVSYSGILGENQSTSAGGDSGFFLTDNFTEDVMHDVGSCFPIPNDALSSIVSSKGGFLIDRQSPSETDADVKMKLLRGLIDNGVHIEDKSIVLIDPQPVVYNFDRLYSSYGKFTSGSSIDVSFAVHSRSNSDPVLTQAASLKGCLFVCDFAADVKDLINTLDLCRESASSAGDSSGKAIEKCVLFDGSGVKTSQGLSTVINDYGVNTLIVESVAEAQKVNHFASRIVSLILKIVPDSKSRGFSPRMWAKDILKIQSSCCNCKISGISLGGSSRLSLLSKFAEECGELFAGKSLDTFMLGSPQSVGVDEDLKNVLAVVPTLFSGVRNLIVDVSDQIFVDTVSLALKIFARRLPAEFQQLVCGSSDNFETIEQEHNFKSSDTIEVSSERNICNVYFIADGIYGFCNGLIYSHKKLEPQVLYHNKLLLLNQIQSSEVGESDGGLDVSEFETKMYPSKVFGQTCDGLDCVVDFIQLPILSVGDWLWIPDFESRSTVVATTFNGFDPGFKIYCRIRDC